MWEKQAYLHRRQAELKRLEDERIALLNRVERDVFIVFCIFYFACHLVFLFSFYFGVSLIPNAIILFDRKYYTNRNANRVLFGSRDNIHEKMYSFFIW